MRSRGLRRPSSRLGTTTQAEALEEGPTICLHQGVAGPGPWQTPPRPLGTDPTWHLREVCPGYLLLPAKLSSPALILSSPPEAVSTLGKSELLVHIYVSPNHGLCEACGRRGPSAHSLAPGRPGRPF